ncbi:MAG: phosphate signaling complex protein PhoU [Chloroflexi bacterium]|nr:phosphate signaling complex protein PhoU [Chloroflexota bacterium]
MPREGFHRDLELLQDQMLELGSMVDRAIDRALTALLERNIPLAEAVVRDDGEVNRMRYDIDTECLALLAQQAPVAGDLRVIVSVLSIVGELERIGDHAEGIARIVIMMADEPLVKPLVDIPRMADRAQQMLRDSLTAFTERDVEAAYRVGEADDVVDELQERVYHDLVEIMLRDPSAVLPCTHLLWVSHNLERIADRATNVAERAVFAATGTQTEMNISTY